VNKRQAGVLLHPSSLPNADGKPGQLNEQAWLFLDWMAHAGLTIWQMLPLTQPHEDLSPYQAVSAFALNPALLPDNWLIQFEQFGERSFADYLTHPPHWLEDYVLFMVIRDHQNKTSWRDWPHELKMHEKEALQHFAVRHQHELLVFKRQQFVLFKIWQQFKMDANQKGIQLFGDMPIFVAFDSADVWANPDQFKLDEEHNPTVVTGVPPDYFSEIGQRWGNPHYNWDVMQLDGFNWWHKRIAQALTEFDLLRIDHFRGLEAAWEIKVTEETAINGQWVKAPGLALLNSLKSEFPNLPIIAEDLGSITSEVVALKERYGLPGMSVLQFGFNGLPDNPHSLYEQVENSVTYTGTHDNDTTLGWFQSLDDGTKNWILEQLQFMVAEQIQQAHLPGGMPWLLIAAAFNTVAQRVIVPMQDFLMLDSGSRMNVPGTAEGNWRWQFDWSSESAVLADNLRVLLQQTDRL
jgi:4-alpha-glucanotransferase